MQRRLDEYDIEASQNTLIPRVKVAKYHLPERFPIGRRDLGQVLYHEGPAALVLFSLDVG